MLERCRPNSKSRVEWCAPKYRKGAARWAVVDGDVERCLVKAAKRGNDYYHFRVRRRLEPFDTLPECCFFQYPGTENQRSEGAKTSVFAGVLTYDPKRRSLKDAWEGVGRDFDGWTRAIESEFGAIKHFRTWECHCSGYPHVHFIIVLLDRAVNVFFHLEKVDLPNGKTDYRDVARVQETPILAHLWTHGYIDVEACQSVRGAFSYALKYVTKVHQPDVLQAGASFIRSAQEFLIESSPAPLVGGVLEAGGKALHEAERRPSPLHSIQEPSFTINLEPDKALLTLSMMWIFRKRAFGMSTGLLDLMSHMHNYPSCRGFQHTLSGAKVVEWSLVGFFSRDELERAGVSMGDSWRRDVSFREFQGLVD